MNPVTFTSLTDEMALPIRALLVITVLEYLFILRFYRRHLKAGAELLIMGRWHFMPVERPVTTASGLDLLINAVISGAGLHSRSSPLEVGFLLVHHLVFLVLALFLRGPWHWIAVAAIWLNVWVAESRLFSVAELRPTGHTFRTFERPEEHDRSAA